MQTIAAYARVSTQRQAQANTTEQQLERLRSYAEAQGWGLPAENVFRDDGYSGPHCTGLASTGCAMPPPMPGSTAS